METVIINEYRSPVQEFIDSLENGEFPELRGDLAHSVFDVLRSMVSKDESGDVILNILNWVNKTSNDNGILKALVIHSLFGSLRENALGKVMDSDQYMTFASENLSIPWPTREVIRRLVTSGKATPDEFAMRDNIPLGQLRRFFVVVEDSPTMGIVLERRIGEPKRYHILAEYVNNYRDSETGVVNVDGLLVEAWQTKDINRD